MNDYHLLINFLMQLSDKEPNQKSNGCRVAFLIISLLFSALGLGLYLYLFIQILGTSIVEIMQNILFFGIQMVNTLLIILYFTHEKIGSYLKTRNQVVVGTLSLISSIMALIFSLISYSQS